jgi:hypothetical protein
MAKDRPGVRFAVGTPRGCRATVWRLWTNPKGDVYVAARALAGSLKVSLHVRGNWRMAFIGAHPADPAKDRAFLKWKRGLEVAPGLTRALEMLVMAGDVTTPPGDSDPVIAWTPPPAASEVGRFTVLLTSAFCTAATGPDWPGRHGMGTELVYCEELPGTGETVWVTWHVEPLSDAHVESRERLCEQVACTAKQLPAVHDAANPSLRFLGMNQENGTGVLWDVPLALGSARQAASASVGRIRSIAESAQKR